MINLEKGKWIISYEDVWGPVRVVHVLILLLDEWVWRCFQRNITAVTNTTVKPHYSACCGSVHECAGSHVIVGFCRVYLTYLKAPGGECCCDLQCINNTELNCVRCFFCPKTFRKPREPLLVTTLQIQRTPGFLFWKQNIKDWVLDSTKQYLTLKY